MNRPRRVAIVHEWLTTFGGSERVLEQMLEVFPEADVFTLVDFLPEEHRGFLRGRPVTTSFLQRLPLARTRYRHYLPLMPLAVERFDLSEYDLVLSSSHAVAKGVLTGPDQLHICMCHSPMRYAWDLQHQYLREAGLARGLKGAAASAMLHYMRLWDARTANGVDAFIANSGFIARRIRKIYGREATVIYPPVDTDAFPLREEKEEFYVTVSRMVPYKRMDLIVEAFSRMPDRRLVVIGDGPERGKIEALAGPNVTLLGAQPHEVLRDHLQRARAFVFAAEEDFGIVVVEAQACGTPVIAYGRGGALETVLGPDAAEPTGIFFPEQSVEAIMEAVERFEAEELRFSPRRIRAHAERFGAARFREEYRAFVETRWTEFTGATQTLRWAPARAHHPNVRGARRPQPLRVAE